MTQMRIAYSIINHLLFNLKEENASLLNTMLLPATRHTWQMKRSTSYTVRNYITVQI